MPPDLKSGIWHRMAPLRIVYIMTLTYIFLVTKFEVNISKTVIWQKLLNCDFRRGWYFPSNTVIHFLDLNFQGHKFETLISWKRWEPFEKCVVRFFPQVNICHRIWPFWMLYCNTLMYIFNVKHFLDTHLLQKNVKAADVHSRFVSTRTATAVELLLLSKQSLYTVPTALIVLCDEVLCKFVCHKMSLQTSSWA